MGPLRIGPNTPLVDKFLGDSPNIPRDEKQACSKIEITTARVDWSVGSGRCAPAGLPIKLPYQKKKEVKSAGWSFFHT
jgi:hypothetical protein